MLHLLIHAWQTLEQIGIWKILLSSAINLIMANVILVLLRTKIRHLRSAWHEHLSTQHAIANRLDSTTPGGLGELKVLQTSLERIEQALIALSGESLGDPPDGPERGAGRASVHLSARQR